MWFMAPLVLFIPPAMLYSLILGRGRPYLGIALMIFGGFVLAISTMTSCDAYAPNTTFYGVIASVWLGWLGFKLRHRRTCGSTAEIPLPSPAPSARTILPEDMLGPWQFYIDAAASTVTVDLQADGRYTQAIVGFCGERTDCPGGTWTLEGPYLDLTSYRSALRNVTERVRWFFGDWQKDWILFAKDDPQTETMLLGMKCPASPAVM
jgi:hypothetical protein